MANIRSIINQAFQAVNIIGSDEVVGETESNDAALAVLSLNQIIAQLNQQQLFPFSRDIIEFTFPTAKNKWLIGTGSEIDTLRPDFIQRIQFFSSTQSAPFNIQQLDLADLLNRSRPTTISGTPACFAYNPGYPNASLYFDVAPSAGSSIQCVVNLPIPAITINSELEIPPQYDDVLIMALARRVAIHKQLPGDTLERVDILYKECMLALQGGNSRNQIPTLQDFIGDDLVARRNIISW